MKQGLENKKGVVYAEYDFAKEGGAIGTINLRGGVVPKGALVTNVTIDVETALTSGGAATIAANLEAAADMKAATAVATYALNAIIAGIPVGTAATTVRTTANRKPTITVAAAALTAGKMTIAYEYLVTR